MNPRTALMVAALVPLGLTGSEGVALAQEPEVSTAAEEIGLNLDVGFATAYVFRGWNMFQKDSQMDPHMLLAPGASWAIGDSGVTVSYWSAYQLTGTNMSANTDGALNDEQDLILTYDLELPSNVGLSLGLQTPT